MYYPDLHKSGNEAWSQGSKNIFKLNSAEHKILIVHTYIISRMLLFTGSDKPRMLFSLFINIKMLTIVVILTCMSRK